MADQTAARVLLVEDTGSMAMFYRKLLECEGLQVEIARNIADGRAAIDTGGFHVYILDLMLPDGSGLELLEHATSKTPDVPAIVITADGSINRAVEAMRLGAFDFMVKPFSEAAFVKAACNAASVTSQREKIVAEPADPEPQMRNAEGFCGFVGNSPEMTQIYDRIERLGTSTATVFITGESGTGKEVCADAIHRVSRRAKAPFIALNCGAIPSELLESEVFGHLKGSFTGAISDKLGAARAADRGTLFLDEICELPLHLQTKLLRFLQTSTVTPVGATKPVPVDVRIVCATNRDPALEVREGRFREDLFFRLHVVPIHLPPLRERGSEILLLARHFLRKFAKEEGKALREFSADACVQLMAMRWQGNVRQLENLIRMIAAVHDGPTVTAAMLPVEVQTATAFASNAPQVMQPQNEPLRPSSPHEPITAASGPATLRSRICALIGEELGIVEEALIEETISSCGGSIPQAARILNVSPSTIYRKKEAWAKREQTAKREIQGNLQMQNAIQSQS